MMLPNPQLEQFATHIAAGMNQSEAARRAGYSDKSAANLGCRLLKREDVRLRVMELSDSPDPTKGTVGKKVWIISETVDLYRDSRKAEQFQSARQCLEFLARLQGYLVEHKTSDRRELRVNVNSPGELREVLNSSYTLLPPEDRAELDAPIDVEQAD